MTYALERRPRTKTAQKRKEGSDIFWPEKGAVLRESSSSRGKNADSRRDVRQAIEEESRGHELDKGKVVDWNF